MSYSKHYIVRWSEIDLNMHMTSSAYVKYITDTRMSFFVENGFGLEEMEKLRMGPIVLWEKSYFFKEIRPDEEITVKLWNSGASEDGRMIRLEQRIYDQHGTNTFLAYTLFAIIDQKQRRIATPPLELASALENMSKSDRFRVLKKEELRDQEAFPL
ncbi:acyl-CoA thioesterase [Portibacter marinus]|uniref:acyl-CoA thioesterase n=1 Tax=Portibacter marinus TaxID=2898660 RepID=UPI001F40D0EA|nr:acyl-CoA thioesterase [Portibacter marinus]